MPLKLSRDSQTREQPYGGVVICGVFLGLMVGVVVDRKNKTRVSTGSEKWGLLSSPVAVLGVWRQWEGTVGLQHWPNRALSPLNKAP